MADLVRSTLRLRPDRVIVGEVRGAEALAMLKGWNTSHPGGIATVHVNSAVSAVYRLGQLVQETVITVPRRLIAEAIDMIVFIAGRGLARRVATIARVAGVDPDLMLADLPKGVSETERVYTRAAYMDRRREIAGERAGLLLPAWTMATRCWMSRGDPRQGGQACECCVSPRHDRASGKSSMRRSRPKPT